MDEALTRWVPWSPREAAWARNRTGPDRTPLPAAGDTVWYRHDDWGPVTEATVLAVQSLEDVHDPNVCRWHTDDAGDLVLIEGRPVAVQGLDPWPTLTLATRYGRCFTREARLRGSAGWLPHGWETKWRPGPHQEGW